MTLDIRRLDPPEIGFYGQELRVPGLRILAHSAVSDAAMLEAARRADRLLAGCPGVRANLEAAGAELHVIGASQRVTDLPMYRHMAGVPFDGALTMDQRGRGYGGLHCCTAEESLLDLPTRRHADGRDVAAHEIAHCVFDHGLDPSLRRAVTARYEASADHWRPAYASTNADEFFAELTMWWVGSHGDRTGLPAGSVGPAWLAGWDPDAYALIDGIWCGRLAPERATWDTPRTSEADRSPGTHAATTLVFENRTPAPVALIWLDHGGREVGYGSVPAGAVRAQRTFVGHVWRAVVDGQRLGTWAARENPSRILLGPTDPAISGAPSA